MPLSRNRIFGDLTCRLRNSEKREQLRTALNLVDDDQTFQRLQGKLGVHQAVEVLRIFEVEVVHLAAAVATIAVGRLFADRLDMGTRQRRLATLAGTEDSDDSMAPEISSDPVEKYRSFHVEYP